MYESGPTRSLEKKIFIFTRLYTLKGIKTNTAKKEFYNLTDGIVLASVDFYNITKLEHNLDVLEKYSAITAKLFDI